MNFQILYPKDIDEVMQKKNALLVDIRTRKEYLSGHWPKAVSYPYEDNEYWEKRLPRNRYMIIYCDHGGTSMQVARNLGKQGYLVYTVIGGYETMKKIQENYFKM